MAAAGIMILGACSSSSKSKGGDSSASGGTMRMAVVGIDHDLDPVDVVATNQTQMVLVDLLADGLTTIDPATMQPAPSLADKWSADDAGTTWTFDLKDHVTFADGTPVTASSVVSSLEHVARRPDTLQGARLDAISGRADFVAGRADRISGLDAPSDHKLRITTTLPDAELPALLGSPLYGVVKPPETAADTTTTAAGSGSTAPVATAWTVGAGPFRPDGPDGDLAKASRLVRTDPNAARIESIDLVRVADAPSAIDAVRGGQADWASAPAATPPTLPGSIVAGGSGMRVETSSLGAEEFFGMNLASPTFANQQFRQAIVRAVDGTKVIAAGMPGLLPSPALVPIDVPGFVVDPCGEPCRYGPEQARYLVGQAFPDGQVPLVEIDTSDGQGDVAAANSVRDQLVAVGIPAAVKAMPFAEYQTFVTGGLEQLFRSGWVGMAPAAGAYLGPMFRSKSLDNLTAFGSPEIDTELDAAAAEPDFDKRNAAYAAIEQKIVGLAPALPLGSYRSAVALSAPVRDYVAKLDGTFEVSRVSVESLSTSTTG
jgi:ABC-type transport system substrate-binding protein